MKKLESSLKNMVIVLTTVSIVAAALLGYMNELTKEPIALIAQQNLEAGIRKVIIGADSNQQINVKSETITEEKQQFVKYEVTSTDGKWLGTAVKTTVNGFSPNMVVLAGFGPDGQILGYEVLEHAETPGLGEKAGKWFQKGAKGDIIGKNPAKDHLTVSKDGGQIDAISGATITSRALLRAINIEYEKVFDNKTNGNTGATNVQSAPQAPAIPDSSAVASADTTIVTE